MEESTKDRGGATEKLKMEEAYGENRHAVQQERGGGGENSE